MRQGQWAALALMVFASAAAVAGRVQPAPVTVSLNPDGSGSAHGDMLTARGAPNDYEFIGCGVRKSDDGVGGAHSYGFCQAMNAAKESAFCSTENSELLKAIQSIADYSFITFSWRADGVCRSVGVSTQSFYLP
jgi:hypothetical protein